MYISWGDIMKTPLGIAAAMLVLIWTANADARGGSRVSYGGGHHTTSHGGTFVGGFGSSHRGGSYRNFRTGNQYGTHQ
jgi:hypothetical protein